MQVTKRIHALKIPFTIPVSKEITIERFAFVYLLVGEKIHVIDSGVAGAQSLLWDYIEQHGRKPEEISTLLLTHSHPDHIGAAQAIKARSGCTVISHEDERNWIEDTAQQFHDRPVPGFQKLVDGPVKVDRLVAGGETLELEKGLSCRIIHTPGHSKGSVSLYFADEKSLFTGDALAFPGDLPIYEDIAECLRSITALQRMENVDHLFSSWEPPIQGRALIAERMGASIAYLKRIHAAVIASSNDQNREDIMLLCQQAVKAIGLPPFAANPLVARAFASSLAARGNPDLS